MVTDAAGPPGGGDDRLLGPTRLLALIIVPVLVAAFTVLFAFPGSTQRLWAWTIRPGVAASVMGGAYLAGAWFFARSLVDGRWHRVAVGWLAVIPFTALLGVATGIHWDRFNHDHVSFWAWLILYTATPVALPVLWARNHRAAAGAITGPAQPELPGALRWLVAASGGALLATAAVVFVRPQSLIGSWPWALTPLTARTLASFATFLALVWLAFAVTGQWSRLAIPFEATTLGLLLVAIAVGRGRHELAGGTRTAVFSVVLGTALVMSIALVGWASAHAGAAPRLSWRRRRPARPQRGRALRH